jgi:hypothetical protein
LKFTDMYDKNITLFALQKLIDYQMPTGEWGYYDINFKNRYLRVSRKDYLSDARLRLFRKPNVYRTLTAMEVLKSYCGNKFNSRIQRAVGWLKRSLSSGWFIEWDEFSTGPFPDRRDLSHIEKAPDIRHTAQALLGLLKFDRNPGPELPKGLYNILNHQFEYGMWPRKPGFNGVEIFRSVCCADLLFHAIEYKNKEKLYRVGLREDFFQKARVALDRTCAWLVGCADKFGGLWEDEYQTAMVLERLGQRLLADKRYARAIESAVSVLLERVEGNGWTNSAIRDQRVRFSDVSRYENTVRILASLCIVQGENILVLERKLRPVFSYMRDCFKPDRIDASDYRYFLFIFCPDRNESRDAIQREQIYDYLDVKQLNTFITYSNRDAILDAMSLWVIDCLERLERLSEGKALGLPNYDQASLEKEEELLSILSMMRLISVHQPMGQLPSSLLEYFQTGDLQSLWGQLGELSEKYRPQIENKPPLSGRVYSEIKDAFIELAAKYLELMTKP